MFCADSETRLNHCYSSNTQNVIADDPSLVLFNLKGGSRAFSAGLWVLCSLASVRWIIVSGACFMKQKVTGFRWEHGSVWIYWDLGI